LHLLSVALGDTLQLVLLLDSVRVAGTLSSVDQLLSKALSNGLDIAERGLAGTSGEERDSLVNSAEGRDIDGLSSDGTGGTNSGRVFAGTAVDDGVDSDLDGVLVGHKVDLALTLALDGREKIDMTLFSQGCSGKRTYDLEGVGDNSDSHELLSVVAAVVHQRVGQSLNDGAVGLAESLGGISASGVGDVDGVSQGNVVTIAGLPSASRRAQVRFLEIISPKSSDSNVRQGDVADLDIVVPLVEELDVANLLDNILGKHLVEGGVLDLDLAVVRHFCCTVGFRDWR